MRSSLVVAALVAAVVGACSTQAEELDVEDLPQVVLQPSDLPSTFYRFDEGRQASADAPVGERSDPGRFGRASGWKSRYRRPGNSTTKGPLVLESRADVFDDRDGAREELAALRRELVSAGARLADPPDDLGEEAVVARSQSPSLPGVVFVTAAWRFRNVTASLTANGFVGGLAPGEVVELARKQQRRLERASR